MRSLLQASRRPARAGALVTAALLLLSGCKFQGAASLPLPGGVGGNGYQVKIEFTDVLDLVPQSAVKVNDVTVGTVKDIVVSKTGYTAIVTVAIKDDVVLPENATASLRQTSLLGEKFVSLEAPEQPSTERLRGGMYIGLDRTQRNADIEEVLGALSLVLNGGSLEQLQVINSELTKALKGRETDVRAFLEQVTGFVGGLDDQKTQIVRALDGLDRLSGKLAAQRQVLDVALRDIPQGTAVLADERAQLTKVLTGLSDLGTVATRVINATQQNTVADLKALQPILTQLARAGKDLPNALELLTTYPFPRTVALPGNRGGIRGDYANLYITIDGNPQDLIDNLTSGGLPPLPLPKGGTTVPKTPSLPGGPTLPGVPTVPPLPNLPKLPGVGGLTGGLTGSLAAPSSDLEKLLLGGLL
jgi:phospholipid/cholesterol/gamma-HCH transport system substrate-binding protein